MRAVVTLLTLVLLSAPAVARTWSWGASATADGYEFCWARDLSTWTASACVPTGADTFLVTDGELEEVTWAVLPGEIIYYQICAYNAAGYDIDCAGFQTASTQDIS